MGKIVVVRFFFVGYSSMSGKSKKSYWQAFSYAGDYPRSILSPRLSALRKHCGGCTRVIYL